MSPFTHTPKKSPGRDVTRAGGKYSSYEQNINFPVAAQA
jgi:hypothetical protein